MHLRSRMFFTLCILFALPFDFCMAVLFLHCRLFLPVIFDFFFIRMADNYHTVKIRRRFFCESVWECFPQDICRSIQVGVDDIAGFCCIKPAEAILFVHSLVMYRSPLSGEGGFSFLITVYRDKIPVRKACF